MRTILSFLIAFATSLGLWAQGGSGVGFDPANPPDPQLGYRLTVKAVPAEGGNVSPDREYFPLEG